MTEPASSRTSVKRSAYRLQGLEFGKYVLVSLCALVVDIGLLLTLAKQMHYLIAATAGFLAGATVQYGLSVRFVFKRRKFQHRQWLESTIFVCFGALALAVNVSVIAACVELLSAPLLAAKIAASGISFLVAYTLRKLTLF